MKHRYFQSNFEKFSQIIIILTTSIYFFKYSLADEVNTSTISTHPAYKHYEETLIKTTIDRVKQINNTILLENKPPIDSPTLDINKFFLPHEAKYTSPLMTDIPEFKDKNINSFEKDTSITFEEIFYLSAHENRISLCKKIIETDSKMAVEKIIHYLSYGSPEEAKIIDNILPDIKPDLEKLLIESFQNYTIPLQERRAIAYALGRIKSIEAVPYLWNETLTNPNYEMKYTCIQALANMPHSLSLEQWLEIAQSSSTNISLLACKAIFDYGGVQSEQCIRKIILGEIQTPQKVREYALSRITDYPINILIPFLIEVMEKNPNLAINSANILKLKTGMDFGPAPQLWAKWWEEINTPKNNPPPENPENAPTPIPNENIHPPKIRKQ